MQTVDLLKKVQTSGSVKPWHSGPPLSLEDLGLYRMPDRMHLPPDWVEVVPPGWGMQGKSYYKNSTWAVLATSRTSLGAMNHSKCFVRDSSEDSGKGT